MPGFLKLFVYILFSAALALCIDFAFSPKTSIISPVAEAYQPKKLTLNLFRKDKNPEDLKKALKRIIGTEWNNYSIYVVDYNSKFTMGINESIIYSAASVNKVPILVTIYDAARSGKIDFDKVITVQQDDIQDYGTGSIRYDPPGTTYSVKTLIQLMLQQSDNTAAYILANYVVGLESIQNYINGLGLTQTNINNNKTSNKDMAILFDKIYHKSITTQALQDEMLGFLSNSDFEDRLPGQLPEGVNVYHKIGTATGAVHDVGIVTHENVAYYIGVFTSDVPDEEQAAALIAKISKVVYDYMRKN